MDEVVLDYAEAAAIVLELARDNVIQDPDMVEERARQEKAIEMIADYCDSLT